MKHIFAADYEVDVVIIGGGLVGCALMRALMQTNFKCLLLDSSPQYHEQLSFDTRSLALSLSSYNILKMLDVWSEIKNYVTEIQQIHVSQQYCFGRTHLTSNEHVLGYVVEMPYLNNALTVPVLVAQLLDYDKHTNTLTVQHEQQTKYIRAKIIVGADGSNSRLRTLCGLTANVQDFAADAIVANIELSRSHKNFAYERFTAQGPMALLPLTDNRMALVWSRLAIEAQKLCAMTSKEFIYQLQKEFGYRAGKIVNVGQRSIYKLQQTVMSNLITESVVFIGNAANTLHPVAGQGFNLGLRDAMMLTQCMVTYGLNSSMLKQYAELRRNDHATIRRFTSNLVTGLIPNVLRGFGLLTLDNCSWLKNQIIKTASGFTGMTPDLACGISLKESYEC